MYLLGNSPIQLQTMERVVFGTTHIISSLSESHGQHEIERKR